MSCLTTFVFCVLAVFFSIMSFLPVSHILPETIVKIYMVMSWSNFEDLEVIFVLSFMIFISTELHLYM